MSTLTLRGIHKSFGKTEVLHGIDIEAKEKEFIVFIGPSGCGKSTLLRIIAGLEEPTAGEVEIDGKLVNHLPPSKREIAMVFQSYALYPHLNARDNMSLGLKQAGLPRDQIKQRVATACELLSLDPYVERRPTELSGGQRQRVAIGRAIVRDPKLFLFDEPLSNLDTALRASTRLEIARLYRKLSASIVYVTHDQTEAMTLADRIVVLNSGKVAQIGEPMQLYNDPDNLFVASFFGVPRINCIPAKLLNIDDKRTVSIAIRPENIQLSEAGNLAGTVSHIEKLGGDTNVYFQLADDTLLTVKLFGQRDFAIGSSHKLQLPETSLFRFDSEGQRLR